ILVRAARTGGLALGRPVRDVVLTAGIALAIGTAAGSPVLLRGRGLAPALALLALAAAHDAGRWLVGTGRASTAEAALAGVVALVPVTLGVSLYLVPPFRDWTGPLVLGALAAVTIPVGPGLAARLLGDNAPPAPALRRLDSLIVAGPLWGLAAIALLR
ncbi:MAG: hypothetical protein ACYDAD_05785, partial [Acidimicrobiales bacterium]